MHQLSDTFVCVCNYEKNKKPMETILYRGALVVRVHGRFELTGSLAGVRTLYLRFFLLDHRSVLRVRDGYVRVVFGFLDQFRGILHLNPRLRFLHDRLHLNVRLVVRRRFLAARRIDVTGVLFLVHRHGRVSDERVAAVRSGTVKMPINAITVTTGQSTIYHLIEEGKAGRYVDVIVKVFAVHQQLIGSIGREVTPWLGTMMMPAGT